MTATRALPARAGAMAAACRTGPADPAAAFAAGTRGRSGARQLTRRLTRRVIGLPDAPRPARHAARHAV